MSASSSCRIKIALRNAKMANHPPAGKVKFDYSYLHTEYLLFTFDKASLSVLW